MCNSVSSDGRIVAGSNPFGCKTSAPLGLKKFGGVGVSEVKYSRPEVAGSNPAVTTPLCGVKTYLSLAESGEQRKAAWGNSGGFAVFRCHSSYSLAVGGHQP